MNKLIKIAAVVLCGATLVACADSDDDHAKQASYRLTVHNLTNNQPFSPLAFALHQAQYNPWQVGMAASLGLEKLAEGGDTTDFLRDSAIVAANAGDGIVAPGMSQSVDITVPTHQMLMYSAATMLVNTNDGFTGLKQYDISALMPGESMTMLATVYDAGTEKNTESTDTMPGPADNGIGFDATRDDVGFVAAHQGVVTQDDGLTSSVLNQSHRFESKVAKFTIERIE